MFEIDTKTKQEALNYATLLTSFFYSCYACHRTLSYAEGIDVVSRQVNDEFHIN